MTQSRKFRFRLALALKMTVAELESRMTEGEFNEWAKYYSLEPFGEERADLRNALLCEVIARCNGAKGVKLTDFLLFHEEIKDDLDTRMIKAMLKV